MAPITQAHLFRVRRAFAERAYRHTRAAEWGLSVDDFQAALQRSAAGRFGDPRRRGPAAGEDEAVIRTVGPDRRAGHPLAASARPPYRPDTRIADATPTGFDVEKYLESLQLEDLALASACARGSETAWRHFVEEYRPVLLRLASRSGGPDGARDVADSIYAELFGLEERDGRRRSLFDYYHGRSSLAGWLRAVVAQRLVDRARAGRRLEPLPETGGAGELSTDADPPDVDRARLLPLVRDAVRATIAALEAHDRLRLSLYYARGLKLAAIGRLLGESEATASRKLERTRRDVRAGIERVLRDRHGLGGPEIDACFEYGRTDAAFDLAEALPEDRP